MLAMKAAVGRTLKPGTLTDMVAGCGFAGPTPQQPTGAKKARKRVGLMSDSYPKPYHSLHSYPKP